MNDLIAPCSEEFALVDTWWKKHFGATDSVWPFSFVLDGTPVTGSAPDWRCARLGRRLDDQRDELALTATHPGHGLEVRCVAIRYRDFPVVEWTAHMRQTNAGPCPLVSDLQGLDAEWQHGEQTDFLLRSYRGDWSEQRNIYEPSIMNLWPRFHATFAPTSTAGNVPEGRCSSGAFPYFAVEETGFGDYAARPVQRGFLLAVGWPGRWRCDFIRDDEHGLRIRAGQEQTRLRLKAGESVRTPLIAILFFTGGDQVRTQNLWRRWMIAHNLPRLNGALPPPMLEASTCGFLEEMTRADEANQIEHIERHRTAKLPITHWWMDAGWYPCHVAAKGKNCWGQTGTWEPDRKRFPRGLRAIADHAHPHGIQTIVWFEPERVAPGTWLHDQRPQWLLMKRNQKAMAAGEQPATWDDLFSAARLLDLGHDETRAWLIARIATLIESEGIDVYRQDFNFNPLPYWRDNDGTDREGLCENRYVAGYLAFWDALRERFPHMLIDSCASGGRRNDLETLRRGVALHPTDHRYDDLPVKQCLRHSLFQWMPFFGGPVLPLTHVDAYAFRSTMGLSTVIGFDLRQTHDLNLLRKLMTEWHKVAPCYYGDFYPLTSYSLADDVWMAWQFHRPVENDGILQVFRRPASPHESASLPLRGIEPSCSYELNDFDEPEPTRQTGAKLLAGLRVTMPTGPSSRTIYYCLSSEKKTMNLD